MHESGLAIAVAETLRTQSLDGARVRLLVQGGHAEPDDFDEAFRFHLRAAAPDLEGIAIEIVHLPTDRMCVACGGGFMAVARDATCPGCGGASLPVDAAEHVEVEVVGPDGDDA